MCSYCTAAGCEKIHRQYKSWYVSIHMEYECLHFLVWVKNCWTVCFPLEENYKIKFCETTSVLNPRTRWNSKCHVHESGFCQCRSLLSLKQAGAVGATGDMQPICTIGGLFWPIRWICTLYNIVHILPSFMQIMNEYIIYLTAIIVGDSIKKFRENIQSMLFWLQASLL